MKTITEEQKWINYIEEYANTGDKEQNHIEADKALYLFLNSLGYTRLVDRYLKIKK